MTGRPTNQQNDRPTEQLTKQPTDGREGSLGCYTSNNISASLPLNQTPQKYEYFTGYYWKRHFTMIPYVRPFGSWPAMVFGWLVGRLACLS